MFRNSLQRGAAALAGGRLPRGAIALRGFASGGAAAERIVRFIADDGEEHFGAFTDPSEASCRVAERGPSGRLALGTVVKGVDTILPPVEPPVVYCIGLNYSDHAAEVKMLAPPEFPVVFSKAVTSLIGHKSAIVIPAIASSPPEVDYEAELGVVIGRECKDVSEAEALNYVLGYTVVNDVTARRWQGKKGGGQWFRGKSFDTFLPCGPHIVPAALVPDPQNLTIRTLLNGDLVQNGHTGAMIFSVARIIAFLSQGTTLLPGTLICTGTPAGVGYTRGVYLARGDTVTITIEGVGTLSNPVAADAGDGLVAHA